MSNLLRKVENIKIDGKDYILAFDMESIEVFKELTGKGVVASLNKLATLDDETILYFIASTLRKKEDDKILGETLFNGEYDLFSLVIKLFPVVLSVVNNGFPQPKGKGIKAKKSKAVVKKQRQK
nr:MAG TPA: tail assembly chaperone protein [Caudoviricetes sp.]